MAMTTDGFVLAPGEGLDSARGGRMAIKARATRPSSSARRSITNGEAPSTAHAGMIRIRNSTERRDGMAGSEHPGDTLTRVALPRRRVLALIGGTACAGLLAACGTGTAPTQTPRPPAANTPATASPTAASVPQPTGTAAAGQVLVIEAVEYAFKTMGSIPGGPTTVQLRNRGAESHQAQLLLLNPGVAPDQVREALRQGPGAAAPLATFTGGPGIVAPGATSEVVLDLRAGQYLIACFVPGPDHIAHAAKGMLLPLTVGAPTTTMPMPAVAGTITLRDFAFAMPATFPAGRRLYQVVNAGPSAHELQLLRPAPGKTVADVLAWNGRFANPGTDPAAGPLPADSIGGMQTLSAGGSGTLVLDLPPGAYVAACNVHDQSGATHAHLGMIQGFSVTPA
jgi:hypothetical protein